jgi:hypothetical protein
MIKRFFLFVLALVSIQMSTAFSNEEGIRDENTNSTDIETIKSSTAVVVDPVLELYEDIEFETNQPSFEVFKTAIQGYSNLLLSLNELPDKAHVISIADYSLSANEKRLWVVDLSARKLLFNEYVAHGMGTGEEFAMNFSNQPSSHQSSLGFFVTGVIYSGRHEKSLKLHGMEQGFNDLAYERGIVMHGADYVSTDFIAQNGRLGRSHGCPAVSQEVKDSIIETLAEGSVFFSYYPDAEYLGNSQLLSGKAAVSLSSLLAEASE